MIAFWQMQVNCGGNLRGLTFSTVWLVFLIIIVGIILRRIQVTGFRFDPLPTFTPRYTASGDGTTITDGVGAVITIDDVWQFRSVSVPDGTALRR
jgi:hypothetical protein